MHKHPVLSFWIFLCICFSTLELQLSFGSWCWGEYSSVGLCRQAHWAVLLWMRIFASLLSSEKCDGSWLHVCLAPASMATTLSISLWLMRCRAVTFLARHKGEVLLSHVCLGPQIASMASWTVKMSVQCSGSFWSFPLCAILALSIFLCVCEAVERFDEQQSPQLEEAALTWFPSDL